MDKLTILNPQLLLGDSIVFTGELPKGLRRRNKITGINGCEITFQPLLFWWEKALLILAVLLIGGVWLWLWH